MTPLPPQSVSDVTGYVIHIDGNMVMTDLGHAAGIQSGDTLVVFGVEDTVRHPVTDELMQVRLAPTGTIRMDTVGKISSTGTVMTGAEDIDVEQFVRVSGEDGDVVNSWWEEATTWSESEVGVLVTEPWFGQDNQALELTALGDWASAPFSNTLIFRDALTVEAWVKTGDDDGLIASQHNTYDGGNWIFGTFQGGLFNFGRSSGPKRVSMPIDDNTWHHVAGVLDVHARTGVHYVGGVSVLQFEITQPIQALPIDLVIGDQNVHGLTLLAGQIDELRIWNRALSQEEIRANMGVSFRTTAPGLVAHYTFDDIDPQGRVPDLSGNGNHATLNGNARLVPSTAPITLRRGYQR